MRGIPACTSRVDRDSRAIFVTWQNNRHSMRWLPVFCILPNARHPNRIPKTAFAIFTTVQSVANDIGSDSGGQRQGLRMRRLSSRS